MSDLEITKLCAEAMGIDFSSGFASVICEECDEYAMNYDPLLNDAQAMALVKKFGINIWLAKTKDAGWRASPYIFGNMKNRGVINENLNRAICECVAKMQKDKP